MKRFSWFLLPLLLLVACGGDDIPTLPTLAPTVEGAATIEVAQATAVDEEPTIVPTATATLLPPPPTMAPPATLTPIPEPTATATPEAILLLTKEDFGDNRNPLTGELVDDPSVLQRRPIAVKISNSPGDQVRPQSGLNDADLVFEHTTEGNITRFTAIFYGKTPPKVGSIRSARLIDIELPAMYDAALVYSGSSTGVGRRLFSSDFADRIIYSTEKGYYRTGADKPYEHTLYGHMDEFWQALTDKGQNTPPNFQTFMSFSSEPPAGGTAVSQVIIDYKWTKAEWHYDAETGRYLRWSDGVPHLDENTMEQVSAANVVIISPMHAFDGSICEQSYNGVCTSQSVQVQLWGTGAATVLRDGQRYEVTWQRINRNDMLTFVDADGNPFPLQIGNSWIQVVPSWLTDPVTFTE